MKKPCRFNQFKVVKEIGTEPLTRFFERFQEQLDAGNLSIPNPEPDDEKRYYEKVAELFNAPEALPEAFVEAVLAIEELADPVNKQRLETAFWDSPYELYIQPEASPEHTALRLWLHAPYPWSHAATEDGSLSPPAGRLPDGESRAEEDRAQVSLHDAPNASTPTLMPQPTKVVPEAPTEKEPSKHSPSYTHRRTGKVACLPKEARERINEMLSDGLTYRAIIQELGEEGQGLNEDNMTSWKQGGYQDWLAEQKDKEETSLWEEYALDLVKQTAFPSLNEATIKMATLKIRKAIRAIGDAGLQTSVTDDPQNYIRLLNALARLTTGAINCQNERAKAEQRQAEADRQKADPDSLCVTAETLQKIERLLRLR